MLLSSLRLSIFVVVVATGTLASAQSSANLPEAPGQPSDWRAVPLETGSLPLPQQESLPDIHALLSRGDWKGAEDRSRTALTADPASADARYLLAYALYREGKATDSLSAYTAAARLRRPQASDLMAVAADYVILADYKDADRWFTRVTEWTPENALAWYYRGRVEYNLEEYANAQSAFEQSLHLEPRSARTEDNLGLTLQMEGNTAKAQSAFMRAMQLEVEKPTGYSLPLLNLGSLLVEQGDLKNGISYLEKAVALSPENPKAHEQLARAYIQTKQNALAEHELQTAWTKLPTLHRSTLLGRVYQKQGKHDEAAVEFARTAALNAKQAPSKVPDLLAPAPKQR